MKKKLLLIGAGNVGGFLAYNQEMFGLGYKILGFLDDDPGKIGKELYGYKVLGSIDSIRDYKGRVAVAVGIAAPLIKKKIVEKLLHCCAEFPSFIAKNAWISRNVSLGRGVIIYPGVSINYESKIGDFVTINMNCVVGHNCTLSPYCALAPGANLAGFTYLEEGVDFGIGACSRQNLRVGEGTVVGGQSMLTKDIPAYSKVCGVPARSMK